MKIAWLTPEVPYPPIGGRNGVYNRIVQLSKYNQIYLFSIAYNEEERVSKDEMEKYCAQVHYYNRNESKVKKLLKSLLSPYSVASRTLPQLQTDLAELFDREKIDCVICDFPNMAKNLFGIVPKGTYCTINQHNNEYRRMRDMVKVPTIPLYKRIAYYLESFRLEWYERDLYKKNLFKSVTFFSNDDLYAFQNKWKDSRAELKLFPLGANGFDTELSFDDQPNMLFVGRLDAIAVPNVEASLWFCKNVMPKVLEQVPNAQLIIAGANPAPEVMALANDHVRIIPNYADLMDVYSLADCVILPLQSGGGVKGKLLEAAALKKLVISTSHGIEGTKFAPDVHVLYANEPEDFANQCIKALLSKNDYLSMAQRAFTLFEEAYDWNTIGKNYHNYLTEQIKLR